MRRRAVLFSTLAILAVAVAAYALHSRGIATATLGAPTSPHEDMSAISNEIDALTTADSEVKYSSNPFEYAKDSPALDRLVAKGTPALAVISERIGAGKGNGLKEYLLMVAALRISKVDVATGPEDSPLKSVQEAKQWPEAWDAYARSVPGRVERIVSSGATPSEKNRSLAALGTPAIPFVLDHVSSGADELAPAADQLIQGCVEVQGAEDVHVTPGWAKANAGRFQELRSLTQPR